MAKHNIQKKGSQTGKELTIASSLNDETIVVFVLLCIFQDFSKTFSSLRGKRNLFKKTHRKTNNEKVSIYKDKTHTCLK